MKAPTKAGSERGYFRLISYGVAVLSLLIAWLLASWMMNMPALPSPFKVLPALLRDFPHIVSHLIISSYRFGAALLLGLVTAVPLGILLGRNDKAERLLEPLVFLLYPIPKVVFLPVIIALFKIGDLSKVLVIWLIIFFQILVTVWDAARQVDRRLDDSVRSLGAVPLDLLRHVTLPAVLPGIFTSLRVSLGTAIAVLFIAETFATQTGIGYYLMDAWTRFAWPQMYAGILSMGLLGFFFYLFFQAIEWLMCPWRR